MPIITHTEVTTHSVLLRWSPLSSDQQNGIITRYVINVLEDGQQSRVSVTSNITQYTLEAAPFTDYVVSVAAVNSVGQGPFSDTTEVRTPEDGRCLLLPCHSYFIAIMLTFLLLQYC